MDTYKIWIIVLNLVIGQATEGIQVHSDVLKTMTAQFDCSKLGIIILISAMVDFYEN